MAGVKMPVNYFVEMVMDRIAASKTYKGSAYKDSDSLIYFQNSTETDLMHPETRAQLLYVLKMLAARGERYTFRYLRYLLKKGSLLTPLCTHKCEKGAVAKIERNQLWSISSICIYSLGMYL